MAQIGSTSLLMWHGGINSLLYWIVIAFSIKHLSTNIAPSLSTSHKKEAWPWARYRISKNTWRFWNVKMLSCICILYIWGTSQSMCFDVSVISPPPFLFLIVKTVTHEVLRASWCLSWLSRYRVSVMCWFHVWSVTFGICQHTAPFLSHSCGLSEKEKEKIRAIKNLIKWLLCAQGKYIFIWT